MKLILLLHTIIKIFKKKKRKKEKKEELQHDDGAKCKTKEMTENFLSPNLMNSKP
jgi:hypothetical protein